MAFSEGTVQSSENSNFKLYTGIAPVRIVGINPTSEQLSVIYNRPVEKVADYTGKTKDDKPYSRIDIIVKVNEELTKGEDVFGKLSFFISSEPVKNKDGTKVKVINRFGKTAWVTAEDFKAGNPPDYNTDYDLPYKPCVGGEEELVTFLRAYLGITEPVEWIDGVPSKLTGKKLEDCESEFSIDEIKKISKGDIKTLVEVLKTKPWDIQEVKVLFMVQTSDNNKKYQQVLNSYFAKAKNHKAHDSFNNWISKNNQSVQKYEYTTEWKEYVETPDVLSSSNDLPWG